MRRGISLLGTLFLMLVAAPAASPALVHFTTPSKNIGCLGDRTFLRCDIVRTTVKPPPKPRSCEFDWGNAFGLGPKSRGRRLCVSDSALGGRRILRYGQTLRTGRIVCRSRREGLTCTNPSGHGFFLSRQRIKLF